MVSENAVSVRYIYRDMSGLGGYSYAVHQSHLAGRVDV
jgi:hypothetical protein